MSNLQKKVRLTSGVFLTFAQTRYAGIEVIDNPRMLPFRFVQIMEVIASLPESVQRLFTFKFPYSMSMEHCVSWANDGQVYFTPYMLTWRARELEQEDLPALAEEVAKEMHWLTEALSKSAVFSRVEPAPFFTPVELKEGEVLPEWHFETFARLNRHTTLYDL